MGNPEMATKYSLSKGDTLLSRCCVNSEVRARQDFTKFRFFNWTRYIADSFNSSPNK